jgi:oxygen-independent coproporphyrinogen-3 oxidase
MEDDISALARHGLFEARLPRYTSYPPATAFTDGVAAAFQAESLAALDPAEPVSVYVHVPFCERLCWFCACRTQGTRSLAPVEAYLDALEAELALVRRLLPEGVRMRHLHWGGGTPTILTPAMIDRLAGLVRAAIPPAGNWDFSVEIDPMMVDGERIAALSAAGMTRASIGIQDFAPEVQAAIGRIQPFEATRLAVEALRGAGIASVNADLVYGLPHQTQARIEATLDRLLSLAPDRLALYGYAHVPHFSRRQKLIDETALPGDIERLLLFRAAASRLTAAGFRQIGIDHFARPEDPLSRAAANGRLRRNFQGYTDDGCATLIGLGASAISRLPGGYVQNAAATAAYRDRIASGRLAGARGHRFRGEDRLRARAIEMMMCDFAIDTGALAACFGEEAALSLEPDHHRALARFAPYLTRSEGFIRLSPEGRPLARLVAAEYDAWRDLKARYSKAS